MCTEVHNMLKSTPSFDNLKQIYWRLIKQLLENIFYCSTFSLHYWFSSQFFPSQQKKIIIKLYNQREELQKNALTLDFYEFWNINNYISTNNNGVDFLYLDILPPKMKPKFSFFLWKLNGIFLEEKNGSSFFDITGW